MRLGFRRIYFNVTHLEGKEQINISRFSTDNVTSEVQANYIYFSQELEASGCEFTHCSLQRCQNNLQAMESENYQ